MSLQRKVRIVEVGPRDGLQNEAGNVPTAVKICRALGRKPSSKVARALSVKLGS